MDTTNKTPEQGKSTTAGSTQNISEARTGYAVKEARKTEPTTGTEARIGEKVEHMAEQAKSAVSQVYDEATKGLNRTYEQAREYGREASEGINRTYQQAIEYGRQKPLNAALVAFGAGIGVGLLFAGAFRTRGRTGRIARPVINAIAEIAGEFF